MAGTSEMCTADEWQGVPQKYATQRILHPARTDVQTQPDVCADLADSVMLVVLNATCAQVAAQRWCSDSLKAGMAWEEACPVSCDVCSNSSPSELPGDKLRGSGTCLQSDELAHMARHAQYTLHAAPIKCSGCTRGWCIPEEWRQEKKLLLRKDGSQHTKSGLVLKVSSPRAARHVINEYLATQRCVGEASPYTLRELLARTNG